MVTPVVHAPLDELMVNGFRRIRAEHDVAEQFPTAVADTAQRAADAELAARAASSRADYRETPFVAIDPPGSRDLDQALHIEATANGHVVRYAIADVAAFVTADDPVDVEARRRGVTVYCPDLRASLHPNVLNEQAASLLPLVERPAVVWSISLDQEGRLVAAKAERGLVRVAAALSYAEAESVIDGGTTSAAQALTPRAIESLKALRTVGMQRADLEAARDGVSLNLPSQEVKATGEGYELRFEQTRPVETWNAHISLLTGIAAAGLMVERGVGILRTLPVPDPEVVSGLRHTARALGIDWPAEMSYATRVRSIHATTPRTCAFLHQAGRALRGASYVGFDGTPPPNGEHSAIAAEYTHVTAPLRRLVDRFGSEVAVAASAGSRPPGWVLSTLDEIPELMVNGRRIAGAVTRDVIDFCEVAVLSSRVGTAFSATITGLGRGNRATMQLDEPAVRAGVEGADLELGKRVEVRLDRVDLVEPRLTFSIVG